MTDTQSSTPSIGRNEPCPCKSGKKYKRCCGADAAPKLSQPKVPAAGGPGGFDPSALGNFDPQMMMQMSQALQRLPKGQLQRLQSIMQKAMNGKDVSTEAAEFEKTLPPDFQSMMMSFAGQFAAANMGQAPEQVPAEGNVQSDMSVDQAKNVIAQAVAEGKISKEQAESLLSVPAQQPALEDHSQQASPPSSEPSKIGKFWGKMLGKKDGSTS